MAQGQATKVKKKKKSVLKRAAQSRQRAAVNQVNRTRVRTAMKRLRTAITAGDATAAANLLQPTVELVPSLSGRETEHLPDPPPWFAKYPEHPHHLHLVVCAFEDLIHPYLELELARGASRRLSAQLKVPA